MSRTQKRENILTKQSRIAEISNRIKEPLVSLNHHMDLDWLREAHRNTRKNGAVGIDGQTSDDFAMELDKNLTQLLNEAKSGSYIAPPGRRVYIPKGSKGDERAISIPCFRDKILQRSVCMILEPIYEQIFYDCSFGFRPGRNTKQACARARSFLRRTGGYIVEADIKSFFDTMSHSHLRTMLAKRISDGVLRKLIDKWLKAGVLENGNQEIASKGSVQGGVISPLLSNVYLHYVLDEWFHETVKKHLIAEANLTRFADDFVITCVNPKDADRIMKALVQRFAKFDLEIHPTKSKVTPFRRPSRWLIKVDPKVTRTWTFLGFTFFWGRSLKGKWIIKPKTSKASVSKALTYANAWCKANRHMPIKFQYQQLMRKIRGHQAYFRVTGNAAQCLDMERQILRIWKTWLSRRSRKSYLNFRKFNRLLDSLKYLDPPLPPIVKL